MILFPCPYFGVEVELSDTRREHIAERHPDLVLEHEDLIGETLLAPDLVRISARMGTARQLSRWYADLMGGKHVVVVVAGSKDPIQRPRVITAYIARRLSEGQVEWKRS